MNISQCISHFHILFIAVISVITTLAIYSVFKKGEQDDTASCI
jgi:hypothetical protein